ncbi:DNA damage-inducible protein YebG [Escherichia coli]|uniref:DNA damage-inducible protein YebG n=3 Tax=Enterobacteriaceae TaxID=543 RepID=A0A376TFI5_ECOLX|nr:DNA damage-inducible protein YebG [Escherichia coli]HAI7988957.1 DNA damage-inducible protein YebG [Escherichia coli]
MAVEVKYVVIREGEEKMSFTSKKEADAYDKMLDTADLLDTWLTNSPVQMEDEQREALSLWLAEQKDVLSTILKTGKLPSHRSSVLNPKRKMPHTRPEATCAPDNLYHAFS